MDRKLQRTILRAYQNTLQKAKEFRCDLRTAAYTVGIERIQRAYAERGIFP